MKYPKLFSKGKIGNVEISNRVFLSPMDAVRSPKQIFDEGMIATFEARAKGGVGLIVSPPVCIDETLCGKNSAIQTSILAPGFAESVKNLIDTVHKYDTKIAIQFLHSGRQNVAILNNDQQCVAPSAIPEIGGEMPRELTKEEIKYLVGQFVAGAKIAYEAGADGVELHGAHAYLIHQFMSARSNQRTDEYGGSFENRMRFVTEIVEGIKAIKPENAYLGIRINGADYVEGGIEVEDAVEIAKYLEKLGMDVLNVSTGCGLPNLWHISEPPSEPEACRSDVIRQIKNAVSIPVMAVNHVKTPETAEKILEDGVSDFVGLGRALIADPEFVNKAKADSADKIFNCIGCMNCLSVESFMAQHNSCAMNPAYGEEVVYNDNTLKCDGAGKVVCVVGGGPGGMMGAMIAAKRGFTVHLYEKSSKLGGSMILASKSTGKEKLLNSIKGFVSNLQSFENVHIHLNEEITAEEIVRMNPYATIIAVGGTPIVPPFAGVEMPKVVQAKDYVANPSSIQNKTVVLVGGGMVGLEVADVLATYGNKVTLFEMTDVLGADTSPATVHCALKILDKQNVAVKTGHKLVGINENGVTVEVLEEQKTVDVPADVVVLSLGIHPNERLAEQLEGKVSNLILAGDCHGGGKVVHATHDAFKGVWNL